MNTTADPLFAGLRLPLIAAPMFLVSTPALVIASCRAGIVGACASASARSAGEYGDWLDTIAAALGCVWLVVITRTGVVDVGRSA